MQFGGFQYFTNRYSCRHVKVSCFAEKAGFRSWGIWWWLLFDVRYSSSMRSASQLFVGPQWISVFSGVQIFIDIMLISLKLGGPFYLLRRVFENISTGIPAITNEMFDILTCSRLWWKGSCASSTHRQTRIWVLWSRVVRRGGCRQTMLVELLNICINCSNGVFCISFQAVADYCGIRR